MTAMQISVGSPRPRLRLAGGDERLRFPCAGGGKKKDPAPARKWDGAEEESFERGNARVVMTCIAAEAVRVIERWEESLRERGAAGPSPGPLRGSTSPSRGEVGQISATPAGLRLVSTHDPFDRAHVQKDDTGLGWKPAAVRRGDAVFVDVPESKARKYPACCTVGLPGREVSVDSAMDELFEREEWLRGQGLEVGGRVNMAAAVYGHISKMSDVQLRDLMTRRVTKQRDEVTGKWVVDNGDEEEVPAW